MGGRLQGILFDLDGTLIDSEKNWYESDRKFLEHCGGDYTPELWEKTVGMGGRAMAALVKDQFNLKESLDELCLFKDDLYLAQAEGRTQVFPEMLKLLKAFKLQGLPMAVASGSSLRVIERALELAGIRGYFTGIFSADQVSKGKPAPDLFQFAAEKMGFKPDQTLVFEDSTYGVLASQAAGMPTVAVPYKITDANRGVFQKAELLFPQGMEEFTAEAVLEWIDGAFCQCDDCSFFDSGRCHD